MNYYWEPIKQYHRKEKPNYFTPYYRERSSFIRITKVQKKAQKAEKLLQTLADIWI